MTPDSASSPSYLGLSQLRVGGLQRPLLVQLQPLGQAVHVRQLFAQLQVFQREIGRFVGSRPRPPDRLLQGPVGLLQVLDLWRKAAVSVDLPERQPRIRVSTRSPED